jgi:hypothetical protein
MIRAYAEVLGESVREKEAESLPLNSALISGRRKEKYFRNFKFEPPHPFG